MLPAFGFGRVGEKSAQRSFRPVGGICVSHRTPRFRVNFKLTRQSSWTYPAKYGHCWPMKRTVSSCPLSVQPSRNEANGFPPAVAKLVLPGKPVSVKLKAAQPETHCRPNPL